MMQSLFLGSILDLIVIQPLEYGRKILLFKSRSRNELVVNLMSDTSKHHRRFRGLCSFDSKAHVLVCQVCSKSTLVITRTWHVFHHSRYGVVRICRPTSPSGSILKLGKFLPRWNSRVWGPCQDVHQGSRFPMQQSW